MRIVLDTVLEALLHSPYTETVTVYYSWGLITADFDDNKFVDCAIAASADYVVTEDGHFKVLSSVNFPRVHVISLVDFQTILQEKSN